ncbi:hypothetical protein BGZ46_004213 [Entomortierella lignicola]|nr:hypothetical protein BGZ46_004213 [Entomortierella lignicola]
MSLFPGRSPSPSVSGRSDLSSTSGRSASSSSTFRSFSTSRPRNDISFNVFYQLRLGKLPPIAACEAARKFELARIPFRDITPSMDIKQIHKHFFSKPSETKIAADEYLKEKVLCRAPAVNGKVCCDPIKGANSSDQRLTHIKNFHSDIIDQLIEFRIHQGEDPLESNRLFQRPSRQSTNPNSAVGSSPEEMDKLALAIAKGLVQDQLPLSKCKGGLVKEMANYYNLGSPIPSEKAIEEAALRRFHALAFDLKQFLKSDVALGSFTSDTWSSRNNRKFVCLTYHYLQRDFKPRSVSLGFKQMEAPHTGVKL